MNNHPVSDEKHMTVQEVAETLGVSEQTLRNNIRALFPGLMRDGAPTYLDEKQVTALKLEIERHHNINPTNLSGTGQVVGTFTHLEKLLYIAKALEFAREEIEDLQARLEEKDKTLEPKTKFFDLASGPKAASLIRELRLAVGKGCITARQFREILGITGHEPDPLCGQSPAVLEAADMIREFLKICPKGGKVKAGVLHKAFAAWLVRHGISNFPGRFVFARTLAAMNYRKTLGQGYTYYHNISAPPEAAN